MLSAALGKALRISHQLQLRAVRAAHGLLRRALTQKLMLMLRAVGGHGDGPHGLSPGGPHSCALQKAFARREKFAALLAPCFLSSTR